MPRNRRARRSRPRGHPARVQRALAKRLPPGPEEIAMRQLNRRMWAEASRNPAETELVGPVAILAEHVAGLVSQRWPSLDTDEHRLAVANYLTERIGAAIDGFNPAEYARWREAGATLAGSRSSS